LHFTIDIQPSLCGWCCLLISYNFPLTFFVLIDIIAAVNSTLGFCCRHCEFGRAILQRLLEGGHAALPALKFIGCLRQDQVDVQLALESKVYEHWDASSLAPPKARTREQFPDPSLNFLCWSGGAPSFPESALTKFAEGTEAHNAVKAMKKTLLEEFPNSTVTPTARNQQQVVSVRATGRPDYSIDGGKEPLDPSRLLDMEYVVASDFEQSVQRLGMTLTSLVLDF